MNAIRTKTSLAVCTFAACLAISHSCQAQCLTGDVNLDGTVNMADWLPFEDLLVNNVFQCEADNGDGQINFLDIAGIQQRLLDQQSAAFTDTTTDGYGVGDFFWSTSNLNEGAVNGPLNLGLEIGESITLYLYYSTDGPSNSEIMSGYSVNVATSQSGIIEFTEAETFNHPLVGTLSRWVFPEPDLYYGAAGVGVAQAQSVESDLIIGLTAIGRINSLGIAEEFSSLDTGYDPDATAFLCGRIQIEAIGPGSIELAAGPNDLGIANESDLLQSVFARANISVPFVDIFLGDVNQDGIVDFFDIAPFITVLTNGHNQAEADADQNGVVNFFDIDDFVVLLGLGG